MWGQFESHDAMLTAVRGDFHSTPDYPDIQPTEKQYAPQFSDSAQKHHLAPNPNARSRATGSAGSADSGFNELAVHPLQKLTHEQIVAIEKKEERQIEVAKIVKDIYPELPEYMQQFDGLLTSFFVQQPLVSKNSEIMQAGANLIRMYLYPERFHCDYARQIDDNNRVLSEYLAQKTIQKTIIIPGKRFWQKSTTQVIDYNRTKDPEYRFVEALYQFATTANELALKEHYIKAKTEAVFLKRDQMKAKLEAMQEKHGQISGKLASAVRNRSKYKASTQELQGKYSSRVAKHKKVGGELLGELNAIHIVIKTTVERNKVDVQSVQKLKREIQGIEKTLALKVNYKELLTAETALLGRMKKSLSVVSDKKSLESRIFEKQYFTLLLKDFVVSVEIEQLNKLGQKNTVLQKIALELKPTQEKIKNYQEDNKLSDVFMAVLNANSKIYFDRIADANCVKKAKELSGEMNLPIYAASDKKGRPYLDEALIEFKARLLCLQTKVDGGQINTPGKTISKPGYAKELSDLRAKEKLIKQRLMQIGFLHASSQIQLNEILAERKEKKAAEKKLQRKHDESQAQFMGLSETDTEQNSAIALQQVQAWFVASNLKTDVTSKMQKSARALWLYVVTPGAQITWPQIARNFIGKYGDPATGSADYTKEQMQEFRRRASATATS